MSERYPVGTKVQVKNDGHGSQFRSESERVGEFAGTVVDTGALDHNGWKIPEVCVESATGERRMFLVGDLEEAPAATESAPAKKTPSTIRISDRMAEALTDAARTEDGHEIRVGTRVGTTVALMDRGLVEYNRELTRENGYETHTLTARGLWVKGYLEGNPDAREFLTSMVDAAVRKVGSDTGDKRTETMTKTQPAPEPTEPVRYCGERETQTGYDYTCTLSGPHDTHKAQGMNDQTVYEWPTVIEYSVKIWYRSGAYEGVTHSPEDLAREIFADAVESDGVQFAELHGPSGKLVESKVPVPSEPLSCGRLSCGRVFTEDSSRACVRVRGHYGLHRDRINASSSRVVSWGDNECRTA